MGLRQLMMAGGGGGAPTDPLFAQVVALLHFNGADGSTTFTDEIGNTWAAIGDAKIITAQSQYGGASLNCDGTNDGIICTNAAFAPGTGDFCVEKWVRRVGDTAVGGASAGVLFDMRTAEPSVQMAILATGSTSSPARSPQFFVNGSARIFGGSNILTNAGAFQHLALDRHSGVTRLFVNGTQVGSNYTDTNNYTGTTIYIGSRFAAVSGDRRSWNGQIDDFRYTKASRYTANFTPPTAAFPDS